MGVANATERGDYLAEVARQSQWPRWSNSGILTPPLLLSDMPEPRDGTATLRAGLSSARSISVDSSDERVRPLW